MIKNLISLVSILMLLLSASMAKSEVLTDGLLDPTRPLDYKETPKQGGHAALVLTSVIISDEDRIAVINGERVVENQIVDGAEVMSIQPGRVVMRRGNLTQELQVHQKNFKKSSPTIQSRL